MKVQHQISSYTVWDKGDAALAEMIEHKCVITEFWVHLLHAVATVLVHFN